MSAGGAPAVRRLSAVIACYRDGQAIPKMHELLVVVVIIHSRAFGSQSAFTSGMRLATGDAVVLLDGDLQDPPGDAPQQTVEALVGQAHEAPALAVHPLAVDDLESRAPASIGSYLAQMFEEIKGRPAYLVDEVLNAPSQREEPGQRSVELAEARFGPAS